MSYITAENPRVLYIAVFQSVGRPMGARVCCLRFPREKCAVLQIKPLEFLWPSNERPVCDAMKSNRINAGMMSDIAPLRTTRDLGGISSPRNIITVLNHDF